jgi:DNA adenine methylase
MAKIRPFLKWAGSKYNCIEEILQSLPQGQRLVEPFTGSGVVFMNTNYSSYVLAESNLDLIHIYTKLQNHGDPFIEYCQEYFQKDNNCKDTYYELRNEFNSMPNSKRKSAIFLYLNRHGYNGLCRYNSKGKYNVPFGLYTNPYFPAQEMRMFHQKSKDTQFIHQDFRRTFALAKPGDVIYCDPPYVPLLQTSGSIRYNQKSFTSEDQIELAELAQKAAKKGIPVIISNHDTEFTRYHYRKALIRSFPVPRWISCLSSKRQPVNELIAIFTTESLDCPL